MTDLEELAPDQLFALAGNPACACKPAVLTRLRAIAPSLAKKFDPVPVFVATVNYGLPKELSVDVPLGSLLAHNKRGLGRLLVNMVSKDGLYRAIVVKFDRGLAEFMHPSEKYLVLRAPE